MNVSLEEYFHDFRQNLLSGAEAREDFLEAEFALSATRELGAMIPRFLRTDSAAISYRY